MKNSAFEDFNEIASETLDFARCQRPDGSFYGTSGQCRKGTPTGAKEKEAPKGRAAKGDSPRSELKAKAAEVRDLDKQAKAANKAADKAEKAWRKGGAKPGAEQKEVRRLDKEAKAKDKEADKASRELKRMRDGQSRDKKREANVKLNSALQDGPKATPKQRASAIRNLRAEQRRLENMEDENRLSKAGAARLKLVKSSLRQYEIDGKQRMTKQVGR